MDPRIARIQDQLRRERLDAFVLTNPHDVLYATGYASIMERWSLQEPISAAIVVQGGPTILCLPEANIALLTVLAERGNPDRAQELRVFDLLNFCEMARVLDPNARSSPLRTDATEMYAHRVKGRCEPELMSSIAVTLREHGLASARIGFDDLRVGHVVRRLDGCQGIDIHDALDAMIRARVVKTPDEHAAFRRIGKRADKIIQYAAEQLRPGTTWDAVQRSVAGYMTQLDVAPVDDRALLFGGAYAGEFTPEMFRTSHAGELKQGDIVILETLGSSEDFWIDINRTATLGEPQPDFAKLHGIVRDAFLTMIDAMRPGANTADVQRLGLRAPAQAGRRGTREADRGRPRCRTHAGRDPGAVSCAGAARRAWLRARGGHGHLARLPVLRRRTRAMPHGERVHHQCRWRGIDLRDTARNHGPALSRNAASQLLLMPPCAAGVRT